MTTFNTGNPLGSTDVYDRYDNSENLDNFSNGPLDAYPDRFGVSRQSLQGIRNASQYVGLGPYGPGLVFTSRNQVFSYLGEFYAPSAGLTLPYTTTGSGAGEIATFRSVGDAVLRGDLSAPSGWGLIGISDGVSLDALGESIGAGFLGAVSHGATPRTIQDRIPITVDVRDFGAVGDGVADDTAAFQAAITYTFAEGSIRVLKLPFGTYRITGALGIPDNGIRSTHENILTSYEQAIILVDTPDRSIEVFTSQAHLDSPTSTDDLYSGRLTVEGIIFKGDRTKSIVFDGDALYNLQVRKCTFMDIFTCFISKRTKMSYVGGYFQSLWVTENSFTNCGDEVTNPADIGGIIVGASCFNTEFSRNICESGSRGYGVHVFGGESAVLRIVDNVFEGNARFVKLSNAKGARICGNYLEQNIYGINSDSSTRCDIEVVDNTSRGAPSNIEVHSNLSYSTGVFVRYNGQSRVSGISLQGNTIAPHEDGYEAVLFSSQSSRPQLATKNHVVSKDLLSTVYDVNWLDNQNYRLSAFGYTKQWQTNLPVSSSITLNFDLRQSGSYDLTILARRIGESASEEKTFKLLHDVSAPGGTLAVVKDTSTAGTGITVSGITLGTNNVTVTCSNASVVYGGTIYVSIEGSSASNLLGGGTSADLDCIYVSTVP